MRASLRCGVRLVHSAGHMNPFGLPPFDPSKMDPKLLMELSQLVQQLPPEQLAKMQMLMHNAQAGFDVKKDMEAFEQALPPGFREKVIALFASSGGVTAVPSVPVVEETVAPENMDVREARLTILRAVAEGRVPPEEAERLLFG